MAIPFLSDITRIPDDMWQNLRSRMTGMGGSNGVAPVSPEEVPNTGNPQFDQVLAPYRNLAARVYSPYSSFGPGNTFAANHPRVAGMIDNALLTLANMGPTGATVGENISNVARGIVGARQSALQHQVEGAELPYQLASPALQASAMATRLGLEKAQTAAELSRIPYEQSMEQRNLAMENWYMRRMQNPNTASIEEQLELRKYGLPSLDQATPDQAKQIMDDLRAQRQRASLTQNPNTAYAILADPNSSPAEKAYAQSFLHNYINTQSQIAGGKTGAEQNAPHPFADMQSFLNGQQQSLYNDLSDPGKDPIAWAMKNYSAIPAGTDPMKAYQKALSDYKTELSNRKSQFAKYKSLYQSKKLPEGTTFQDWQSQSPTGAPANSDPLGIFSK